MVLISIYSSYPVEFVRKLKMNADIAVFVNLDMVYHSTLWVKSISSLPRNRSGKAHKENALIKRKKNDTALVIWAIPPNLKLLPCHRKPCCLRAFSNSPSWARTNNPSVNSRVLYQRVRSHTENPYIRLSNLSCDMSQIITR